MPSRLPARAEANAFAGDPGDASPGVYRSWDFPMPTARRFSEATLEELAQAKILGVRAGSEHRYTGVWVVVVEGRAFVRSWNDKPTGWYRAFQAQPLGSIQLAGREIAVRAMRPRGDRLRDAVVSSTLRFSLIRMRNAAPRGPGNQALHLAGTGGG